MKQILTVLLALAFAAAACSSSDDSVDATPEVVVAAGSESETATDEEQTLEFAQCMRDNGVDMEDPTVNADGTINLSRPGNGSGDDGEGGEFDAAFEACSDILEGATFLGGSLDETETQDQLLEFAQCLRDQGLDVDDPDLSNFGPGDDSPFGENFDPQDPANAEVMDACSDIFTGFGGQDGQ